MIRKKPEKRRRVGFTRHTERALERSLFRPLLREEGNAKFKMRQHKWRIVIRKVPPF